MVDALGDALGESRFVLAATLAADIRSQFTRGDSLTIRKWFVDTFLYSPATFDLLPLLAGDAATLAMLTMSRHRSVEHAAIGARLLALIDVTSLGAVPGLYHPDEWSNLLLLTSAIKRIFRPWEFTRYDPDTENWFRLSFGGSWIRRGKGKPSTQHVESLISGWLAQLDPVGAGAAELWSFALDGWNEMMLAGERVAPGSMGARLGASLSRFGKLRNAPARLTDIRNILEGDPLMWVDSSVMNRIRDVYPFANGVVSLRRRVVEHFDGSSTVLVPGTLLPDDGEYLFTNANPLPWNDGEELAGRIGLVDDLWEWQNFNELWEYADALYLRCPTYWSFLTHAFPDVEERDAFLRVLGAAMYGTNLKLIAAVIGEPNAGKDTVLKWLDFLMPGQVATLPSDVFTEKMGSDTGFASLRGARVATLSGEVGEGGHGMSSEKLKSVTSGGGKMRVAEKYEKPVDVFFDGVLFLQGNTVPKIRGGDSALYKNRLVAIEFKHAFPLRAVSFDDLYRVEAASFAQLLFIHFLTYEARGGGMAGIRRPGAWTEFQQEFIDDSNMHSFLENCIVVDSSVQVPCPLFNATLSLMVHKFGHPQQVGAYYWGKRLRALGFPLKGANRVKRQVTVGGVPGKWVYNLRIDASLSDGAFTQLDVDRAMADAAVGL